MKIFVALLFAVAGIELAASQCSHFSCLNPKLAVIQGVHVPCEGTRFCNSECRNDGLGFPICLDTERVCPYDCDENTIHLNGVNFPFTCPWNKECNKNKVSCNACVDKVCESRNFTCIDDTTVFYQGVYGTCSKGTVCNSANKYPCTFCIGDSDSRKVGEVFHLNTEVAWIKNK